MAVGVVAEYNPFHNGHRYLLEEARRRAGDEPILVVMSGNAVQRGELALFEKHFRAEAALKNGADLVAELPAPWALSSAEGFARGALAILGALGCDQLAFGSESGEEETLLALGAALASPEQDGHLRDLMRGGLNYGEARQRAAEDLLGEKARYLRRPNDLLAAEYLAAAARQGRELRPLAVLRRGAEHDSSEERDGFASATHLRELLERGEKVRGLVPSDLWERYAAAPRPLREREEAVLLGILRSLPKERFLALPGAAEGFGYRLYRAAKEAESLDRLYEMTKTRRYSHARIRRMALWAALGMAEGDGDGTPPYLRILGATGRGRELLRSGSFPLPVLVKPAAVRDLGVKAERIFELEARLTDFFTLALSRPEERRGGSEWRKGPVML